MQISLKDGWQANLTCLTACKGVAARQCSVMDSLANNTQAKSVATCESQARGQDDEIHVFPNDSSILTQTMWHTHTNRLSNKLSLVHCHV